MLLLPLYIYLGFFIISDKKNQHQNSAIFLSHLKILAYSNLPELMFANSLCIIIIFPQPDRTSLNYSFVLF